MQTTNVALRWRNIRRTQGGITLRAVAWTTILKMRTASQQTDGNAQTVSPNE